MDSRSPNPTQTPRDPLNLTFSQANSYEEIPGPLKLEELPKEARTQIWNVFYESLDQSVDRDLMGYPYLINPWRDIMSAVHSDYFGLPLDKWGVHLHQIASRFRQVRFTGTPRGGEGQYLSQIASALHDHIETQPFYKVFDLILFIMRHSECPSNVIGKMMEVFSRFKLAYIIDDSPPPTIIPAATREEGDALLESLQTLREAGLNGGAAHLRNASEYINKGDWAGSIRESIHAVESVAQKIAPGANTLKSTLDNFEKKHRKLHSALKGAFVKLYGYTSDEQGIRHALLDETEADVGMDEAVFMLGACASFASYLWRKHQANKDA